ncbi:choice-of-anchor Q domain-containing protein [Mesonia mobilis]|uniref:choice-of-anchor Q domain-containing protein n=1 Tax=Mesonia mobilis TaxID=369791 RepID=UPI0026ECBB4A|nr:choice-of-anchor Q domain-containing protein [Mesonia mobilis]
MKRITHLVVAFAIIIFSGNLSAQVVTSGADDGTSGTLRQEILDASPGEIITFAVGVSTVTLNSEIEIDKDITISGGLVLNNTIDANGNGRIFNITSGSVTLDDLNLINGVEVDGGAIYITNADLFINDCEFNDNTANGTSGSGGAIFVDTGATINVTSSIFYNNIANRAGGAIEDNSGAGLSIEISNTDFEMNNAGVSPATAAPGNGGAIHITGAGDIEITDGSFEDNMAASEGGALWNGSGSMTVSDVFIDGNVASGDSADQGGGGIYNLSGMLTVENNTLISNNMANGTSGSGGGILNDAGGMLTVTNSEISANVSNRAGGGIEDNSGSATTILLTNVNLDSNITNNSPGNGGGLHITGAGNIEITGGTVNDNEAGAEGGGLWNGSGSMWLDGVTVDGNVASGNDPDQGGGGIYNLSGMLTIENNTIITNNIADGTSGSGGGILIDVDASLMISDSEISANIAARAGGGIEDNSTNSTTLSLINVDLDGNIAQNAPGNGGALHITGNGNVDVTSCIITNNEAGAEGGGLWNGSGILNVDNSSILGNIASGPDADHGGGGIFNNGGTLNVYNSTSFEDNWADGSAGSGGALLSIGGDVSIEATIFETNSAVRAGGAIEVIDGNLTILNSDFYTNDVNGVVGVAAPGNGGAIHITGAAMISIETSEFFDNSAANEGGALWNQVNSTINVYEVTVDSNTAADGGGVYNNGGILNIEASTVSNNEALVTSGGGISNDSGELDLFRSTVASNVAATMGGGVYNNDVMSINAVTIAFNDAATGGGLHAATQTEIKNTLLAENTASSGVNISGSVTSLGYNLVEEDDESILSELASDILDVVANISPLQDNGGATQTILLASGSAAIDAGDPADVFNDQRNYSLDNIRDIGAFELNGVLSTETLEATQISTVYPNPSSGRVNIEIDNSMASEMMVNVYSLQVQQVYQSKLASGVNQLNLNQLSSGVYVMNISTSEGKESHKIVIQ